MASLYQSDEVTYAWLGPVTKVEKDKDGNVFVYGKVTDGTVDSDEQIVDPAFAKKALAEWYNTGANVRQMHATTLPPAGKGILLESLPDGEYVRSKVVEPTAQKLCLEEVYQGYSVGISRPRIVRDARARGGRITDGKIVEVSLVDRPANPMAKFAVLKMEGGHLEYIGKVESIAKRDFDPGVGGGVDRDKLPARDFAGPGRSYPIHTPADVEDAAALVGQAADPDAVRARIIAIARRKGPEFEAKLPEKWTQPAAKMADEVLESLKAAGIRHTHEHPGPGGVMHTHEHVHSQNHGDHSLAHAHQHAEELVTDEQQDAAPEVAKADGPQKCVKCKGVGKIRKGALDCPVCGGTGEAPAEKQVAPPPPIGFPEHDKGVEADAEKGANPFAKDGPPAKDDAPPAKDAPPAAAAPAAAPAAAAAPAKDPDADGDADTAVDPNAEPEKPPVPLGKRKGLIEATDDGFVLYGKGGKAIGTHSTMEAAVAQKAAWQQERSAKKAQSRAEKEAKRVAADTVRKMTAKPPKEKKPVEVPWLIRRAHDYSCPVYEVVDVMAAYPSVEKADSFGATTRVAINAELERAVRKYDGKGKQALRIESLTKALGALDVLAGEDLSGARERWHDAFKAANPMFGAEGGPSLPKPGDPFSPERFKRPYIGAGHYREVAASSSVSIPTTDHPVRAEQFTRGPLTEDHQRYLASKLAEFHDAIAALTPDLCRAADPDADGSMAEGRQPPGAFERPPARKEMDNRDSAHPSPKPIPDSQATPGQNKVDAFVFDAAVVPGVRTFTEDDFREALTKTLEPYISKIDSLEKQVEVLGAQPDPNRSAHRGVATGSAVKVDKVATIGKASQKAERRGKAGRVDFLQSLARSSDPTVRIHAVEKLQRMGVALEG